MGDLVLLGQGAEARVYKSSLFGKPAVDKVRFSKKYRHPALDTRILSSQINQEIRLLFRCLQNDVSVPAIYNVDKTNFKISMEYIDGTKVRDLLANALVERSHQPEKKQNSNESSDSAFSGEAASAATSTPSLECMEVVVADHMATNLAKMHNLGIIHGDLTTSNMIISPDLSQLTLIDFGLGSVSKNPESIAVDLYVFERALKSSYTFSDRLLGEFYPKYTELLKNSKPIMSKLAEVRLRGRKRDMTG